MIFFRKLRNLLLYWEWSDCDHLWRDRGYYTHVCERCGLVVWHD